MPLVMSYYAIEHRPLKLSYQNKRGKIKRKRKIQKERKKEK